MSSPDGVSHSFDASANGYLRGEGCGALVLKRLSDAVADGDGVYAVLRGSAVRQDGQSASLTAPNGQSQQQVLRAALSAAGVRGADVAYLEAHGTGTPLGDPMEVAAAVSVLSEGRSPDCPLVVGTVKGNVGHMEGAAGMGGVLAAIAVLQRGQAPPNAQLRELNPLLSESAKGRPVVFPSGGPVSLVGAGGRPLVAGVSSFGYSGTISHVVLEQAAVGVRRGLQARGGLAYERRSFPWQHRPHPLLQKHVRLNGEHMLWDCLIHEKLEAVGLGHAVAGGRCVPAAVLVEMAAAAAVQQLVAPGEGSAGGVVLRDVEFVQPVVVGEEAGECRLVLEVLGGSAFRISTGNESDGRVTHVKGSFGVGESGSAPEAFDLAAAQARVCESADVSAFYEGCRASGLAYGPSFQVLKEVWSGAGEALGLLRKPVASERYYGAHPAVLDGLMQLCLAVPGVHSGSGKTWVPAGVGCVRVLGASGFGGAQSGACWGYTRLESETASEVVMTALLVDSEGVALVSLEGVRFRAAGRAGAPARPLACVTEWVECSLGAGAGAGAEVGRLRRVLCVGGEGGAFGGRLRELLCAEAGAGAEVAELRHAAGGAAVPLLGGGCVSADLDDGGVWAAALDAEWDAVVFAPELSGEGSPSCGQWERLLLLCQALCARGSGVRVAVVTGAGAPGAGGVAGLLRSARVELEPRGVQVLWLRSDAEEGSELASQVLRELGAAAGGAGCREVCYQGPVRREPVVVEDKSVGGGGEAQCSGCYVVTGGLGGLGLVTAQALQAAGAECLVLVSRRGEVAYSGQGLEGRLAALRATGVAVHLLRCDVGVEAEVFSLVADVLALGWPLRGVVHAAGVLEDGFLAAQTAGSVRRVAAPKAEGAWHLHRATAGVAELRHFVTFSSVTALLGNLGQCNYGAANGYLDALCEWRCASGLPGVSIRWPAVSEVGMAAAMEGASAASA